MPDLKVNITYTHTVQLAQLASAQVIAANQRRRFLLFINDSPTPIYLAIGTPAILNRGIRLSANGFWFAMSEPLTNISYNEVYAISAVAGSRLLINEGE